MNPRVSVIMAVYNGEDFLADAVESILGQTFTDFEFLIVDDASTDRSGEILAEMSDPRVRVVRNPENMGLTKSLNKALSIAAGDYIARQDADDASMPERLAVQVEFMDAHPDVLAAGSWALRIDEGGKRIGASRPPQVDLDIRWCLLFENALLHSSVLFRRRLSDGTAVRYDAGLACAQDYDLWSRLASHGRLANMPEYLIRLRFHPRQIRVRRREAQRRIARSIARANLERLRPGVVGGQEVHRSASGYWKEGPQGAWTLIEIRDAFRQCFGSPPKGQMDACARAMLPLLRQVLQSCWPEEECVELLERLMDCECDRSWIANYISRTLNRWSDERILTEFRRRGLAARLSTREILGTLRRRIFKNGRSEA